MMMWALRFWTAQEVEESMELTRPRGPDASGWPGIEVGLAPVDGHERKEVERRGWDETERREDEGCEDGPEASGHIGVGGALLRGDRLDGGLDREANTR